MTAFRMYWYVDDRWPAIGYQCEARSASASVEDVISDIQPRASTVYVSPPFDPKEFEEWDVETLIKVERHDR